MKKKIILSDHERMRLKYMLLSEGSLSIPEDYPPSYNSTFAELFQYLEKFAYIMKSHEKFAEAYTLNRMSFKPNVKAEMLKSYLEIIDLKFEIKRLMFDENSLSDKYDDLKNQFIKVDKERGTLNRLAMRMYFEFPNARIFFSEIFTKPYGGVEDYRKRYALFIKNVLRESPYMFDDVHDYQDLKAEKDYINDCLEEVNKKNKEKEISMTPEQSKKLYTQIDNDTKLKCLKIINSFEERLKTKEYKSFIDSEFKRMKKYKSHYGKHDSELLKSLIERLCRYHRDYKKIAKKITLKTFP